VSFNLHSIEAGGHVRGRVPLHTLLPQVVAKVDVPVIASGGMADGKALAAALRLGAQGAMFGTAFLATAESFAHDFHKQRVVEAQPGATIHTDAFHVNWPKGAFVRVLPNSVTRGEQGDPFSGDRKAIGKEDERTIWLFSTDSPLRSMTGDFEAMALYAGQGAGEIRSIVPASERLAAIVREAEQILDGPPASQPLADAATTASPVCYANTADETYMGYAGRDELLAFLNELLEAERAGARVTARTASEFSAPAMKSLMQNIYRDEARWCAMLLKWIRHLDGEASPRVGAFYEKCMAIGDLHERTVFLNRGQGWVVRKLRDMLPKVRDNAMHADFSEML
jgi:nitronate monooxygenase